MMVRKFLPFLKKRLFTVSMIWLSVVLFYNLVALGFEYMVKPGGGNRLELTPISSFGDGRLVLVLSLAALTLMGVFSLILLNVNRDSVSVDRVHRFLYGLWDEVSSASTHVGAALFASLYYSTGTITSPTHSPNLDGRTVLLAASYVIVGYLAFYYDPEIEQNASKALENKGGASSTGSE